MQPEKMDDTVRTGMAADRRHAARAAGRRVRHQHQATTPKSSGSKSRASAPGHLKMVGRQILQLVAQRGQRIAVV
jgi:hypothetical protein